MGSFGRCSVVVALALAAACDSADEDGGEAEPVLGRACGGAFSGCDADPVGVWTLDDVCGVIPKDCERARVVSATDDSSVGGTVELRADGTVSWNVDVELNTRVEGPRECVPAEFRPASCPEEPDLPCQWSTGLGHTAQAEGTWAVVDEVVQLDLLLGGETMTQVALCASNGSLDFARLPDERDGFRGQLTRAP